MHLRTLSILSCALLLTGAAFAQPFTESAPGCPCSGGYETVELLYIGPDNATLEVFQDDDFSDPANLNQTFTDVDNLDTITLDRAEAANLTANRLPPRSWLRLRTATGETIVHNLFTFCPSSGFVEPLEKQQILGKTYGNFTVLAHTDKVGTRCSIDGPEGVTSWRNAGNVIGANNRLGTLNPTDLVLIANGRPMGIITAAGDVGIGTQVPDARLQVTGDLRLESENGNSFQLVVPNDGDLNIVDDTDVAVMTLEDETQNVGIGTEAPAARLSVQTTGTTAVPQLSLEESAPAGTSRLYFRNVGSDRFFSVDANPGNAAPFMNFNFNDGSSTTSLIRVDGLNRRVGIGEDFTDFPDGYRLVVDGRVAVEELLIDDSSAWPDYVFGSDYALLPIDELKASIAKNRHLPGIPSAAEVEANGIEVGAMQKQLLEKVEELHLYVIQLHERVEVLEAENARLREAQKQR